MDGEGFEVGLNGVLEVGGWTGVYAAVILSFGDLSVTVLCVAFPLGDTIRRRERRRTGSLVCGIWHG